MREVKKCIELRKNRLSEDRDRQEYRDMESKRRTNDSLRILPQQQSCELEQRHIRMSPSMKILSSWCPGFLNI